MDSQQHLPLARERVTLTMLPWIPRPVCRGSRGRPLRALAAVSDCWLMARPAEAEHPGCRCPPLRLEQGCSFWISPITVYPDVRRTPLLTDRHYSCFSLPAEKIIQLRPTQFLLRENASVTDIGIRSAQSIITSSWGLFVYTIHLIFSSVSWELCPILILSWKDLHCRGPVCATEHVLFDAVCVSEVCFLLEKHFFLNCAFWKWCFCIISRGRGDDN